MAHVGKRDSTYQHFDWLNEEELAGQIYPSYYYFMDNDYEDRGFLEGDYSHGPFADVDKMNQIFKFFKQNWTWDPYHENIMHHFHKPNLSFMITRERNPMTHDTLWLTLM